jgi:hypothetical protein
MGSSHDLKIHPIQPNLFQLWQNKPPPAIVLAPEFHPSKGNHAWSGIDRYLPPPFDLSDQPLGCDLELISPFLAYQMPFVDSLPNFRSVPCNRSGQCENLPGRIPDKNCDLDDCLLAVPTRTVSYFLKSSLSDGCCTFRNKQQSRRVSWDDSFTDCHMEDLLEIPSKVSDQTKGIPFYCFLIKNLLKIIPIDTHQVASGKQGNQVILEAILIGHSG